jgi:hypothetical protein
MGRKRSFASRDVVACTMLALPSARYAVCRGSVVMVGWKP